MGKYHSLKFKITGVAPLLLHNGQLANPLNPFSKRLKEVTKKRDKTDADYEEMARVEFYGSLYTMDGGAICLPGEVLESAFSSAASGLKLKKKSQGAIVCPDNYPLIYDGPQSIDDRWADESCRLIKKAKIGQSSVMRTRPMFNNWSCVFELRYDTGKMNERDILQIISLMGEAGLCDWRPKFGRCEIEQVK